MSITFLSNEYGKNAKSLGEGCITLGPDCITGCMAYYIKSVDRDNKKIYLSNTQVTPVFSTDDNTDGGFETPAYDVGDVFNVRSGNHYIAIGKIVSVSNNVITYTDEQGFANEDFNSLEEFEDNPQIDDHTFYVATKPLVGVVPIVVFTFSSGHSLISAGSYGINVGFGNILGGDFGLNVGIGNFTGYATTALGANNYVPGQNCFVAGNRNTVIAYLCSVLGGFNYAGANGIVELGHGLYLTHPHQHGRGWYNAIDTIGKYADVFGVGYEQTNPDGTTTIVRKNAYSLDWDGNIRYAGKIYEDCENGIGNGYELARAELIGFNSPVVSRFADKENLYTEKPLRGSISYETITEDGLTYAHMIPQNVSKVVALACPSLPKFPLDKGNVWIKFRMRTNQTVSPNVIIYQVKDKDGNVLSSPNMTINAVGDGEWHDYIVRFDNLPEGAYSSTYIQIQFAGKNKMGSAFYNTDGTLMGDAYFDIASWAIFTDEVSAESYSLVTKEHTKSLVSYVEETNANKAENNLVNVSNEDFKQKAIDSGLVDYIIDMLSKQ